MWESYDDWCQSIIEQMDAENQEKEPVELPPECDDGEEIPF